MHGSIALTADILGSQGKQLKNSAGALSNPRKRAARAVLAIAVAGATAAAAPAQAADPAPGLCQMVEAFDQALQMRFYRANLAPDAFDCRFYDEKGCPFSLKGSFRIKVTHIAPVGCDESGDCAFMARQVCETDRPSMSCTYIMPSNIASYRVSGRFEATKSGAWTLTNWVREPGAPAWEAATVAQLCPELMARLER